MNNNKPLLEVKGLKTYFYTEDGVVRAVDGVSFEVYPGEVLGLVGESGCGKSVTSLSIMRLISKPGRIDEGQILLGGEDLLKLPEDEMIKVRGESHFDDLSTTADGAEPCFQSWRLTGRSSGRSSGPGQRGGLEARRGVAKDGGCARPRTPRRSLSSRVIGWYGAACDDCYGACLCARIIDCR